MNTKMNRLVFLLPLFFLPAIINSSFAQEILLEQNPGNDTIIQNWGPNRKNYIHSFYSYGFLCGQQVSDSAQINYGNSYSFSVGYRYKRKIVKFYEIGIGFSYSYTGFNIKQNDKKVFPNKATHDKEVLNLNYLSGSIFNRFIIGKRGNMIGNYFDLGVYGGWMFSGSHKTKTEYDQPTTSGSHVTKVINKKLNYLQKFDYGAIARLGRNKFSVYAKYRLSDLFREESGFPELPGLEAGIELIINISE